MKKIVIFLALFISAECLAQNPNQNNNQIKPDANTKVVQVRNTDYKAPELTAEEKIQNEKYIAEQKDFENILKSLTPAQNKKFQKANQDFGFKMMEYTKSLDDETLKISKLRNLIAINTYILKGVQVQRPGGSIPKEMQDFYQKQINAYQKLSPQQKILVKKELIKFRKNINALEKKRRQDFKILLKKDLSIFKERETEKEIEDDNKF
jgi:hypothetical protein